MSGAEVMHADFTNAVVGQLAMKETKACGSIFRNCDMRASHFENADLSGADLKDADMMHASFENCNLCRTIMLGKNLENATFTGAKFDRHTVWPEGFNPLERGAVLIDSEKDIEPADATNNI
jgi:uncharacterized protein YjbI with pentapeptide repeats